MANSATFSQQNQNLSEIVSYYEDVIASVRFYYTSVSPDFEHRFVGYDQEKLTAELGDRLREIDFQTCLVTLAALEAAFRLDYKYRCERRKRDPLSRAFRELYRVRSLRVSLEEEIFEGWKDHSTAPASLI